jgi:hypothetical protein
MAVENGDFYVQENPVSLDSRLMEPHSTGKAKADSGVVREGSASEDVLLWTADLT